MDSKSHSAEIAALRLQKAQLALRREELAAKWAPRLAQPNHLNYGLILLGSIVATFGGWILLLSILPQAFSLSWGAVKFGLSILWFAAAFYAMTVAYRKLNVHFTAALQVTKAAYARELAEHEALEEAVADRLFALRPEAVNIDDDKAQTPT